MLTVLFVLTLWLTASTFAQTATDENTNKEGAPAPFRIQIENGQWIEFQAISGDTGDGGAIEFWAPDGQTRQPIEKSSWSTSTAVKPDHFRRQFSIKALTADDFDFSLNAENGIAGGAQSSGNSGMIESKLSQVADYPNGTEFATVRLKVAAGPWKTIATGHQAGGVQRGVEFLQRVFREENPPMAAIVPNEIADKSVVRMIAEDNVQKLHKPTSWQTGGVVNGTRLQATFPEEIKDTTLRFHVQARDWAVLEFRNVALHQGEQRKVDVLLNGNQISLNDTFKLGDFIVNPPQPFRIDLDEAGSYIELTGITDSKDPDKWWNADGNYLLLEREPQFPKESDEDRTDIEIVWTTHLADSASEDAFVDIDENLTRTTMRKPITAPDGSRTFEHIGTGSVLKRGIDATDVVVKFADGEWNDVAELSVKEQRPYESNKFQDWLEEFRNDSSSDPFVRISSARENEPGKSDRLAIMVAFHEDEAFQYRLAVRQTNGIRQSATLRNGMKDIRSAAFSIPPSSVTSYILQQRPYRIAKFRNVSLHRDHPTSAFVVPPVESAEPEDPNSRQPRSFVLRTVNGETITFPQDDDLEKRISEIQKRGAYLNFERASQKIIDDIKQHNTSRQPDERHIIKPDDLTNLSFLRWKDVPADELHLMRGIAGLEEMSLDTTADGTDLSVLADFSELLELNLKTGNKTPEVFVPLGQLHTLEKLTLQDDFSIGRRGFQSRHLLPLRSLKNLKHLSAAGMDFNDEMLAHLRGLTDLKFLYTGNSVTVTDEGLANFADMQQLDGLVLHRIMATDAGLRFLTNKPDLEWLDIPSDRYTDAGMQYLATLPSLGRVNLSGSQVTDTGIAILAKAPKLREVNLFSTRVTQAGIDALKAAHPDVKIQLSGPRHVVDPEDYNGLALRLVPEFSDRSEILTLTDPHVEALKQELIQEGPSAARERQQHFQWFLLPDDEMKLPITHTFECQRYGLLAAQSDWIMRSYIVRPKLEKISVQKNDAGRWGVELQVSDRDATKIQQLTAEFLKRQLAVTIDDKVLIAPIIQATLQNTITIDGNFTEAEARQLAERIAKPAEIQVDVDR